VGLEIVWIQAGMLGNPGKHSWAYFLAIVKCKKRSQESPADSKRDVSRSGA